MDTLQWESCIRFILKLLQFVTSAFLIFSLYNIGAYWILLIACLAVPAYGLYLMARSPNRSLRHPLPYVRYKASVKNKSWLKVDCIICATMSFVCFGFSSILFFGYFKMDAAASFLVEAAVISLMLSLLYMFNALISARQMQDGSIDFVRMERQPFSTRLSQQSPLTLSPVFDDLYKSNNSGISFSRQRVAPMYMDIANNGYYERPNQQSEMIYGHKKRSVDSSLHKTSMGTQSSSSSAEMIMASRHNLPANGNLWLLNGNRREDAELSSGFNNGSNTDREISSHRNTTATTIFNKKLSITKENSPGKKIVLGADSMEKNRKISFNHSASGMNELQLNANNKHTNNGNVSCITASVLDVTISGAHYNGQSSSGAVFNDNDGSYRKKSFSALTTSPTSYSTYKTNTEPYNRRAMPPEIVESKRSGSATELRLADNSASEGNHYATPMPVSYSNSSQIGNANNTTNSQMSQVSSFLPQYTFPASLHQQDGVHLYSGIQRAVPANVTPAKFYESERNKGSPRFSDSANSSSPDYSMSVGSAVGEPLSSSRSTIRVDALGHSSEWTSKINVNTEPILTTIATAIDSSRENQIRGKKLKRRQDRQSETAGDFDVMIRPRTASFRQSTELNIAKGCGGISPRQITDF